MSHSLPDPAGASVALKDEDLPLSEAVIASDDLDYAQRLFFADEEVAKRLDELAHLAKRLADNLLDYEATKRQNALYDELEGATEGVIRADELESLLNVYMASEKLPGDPAVASGLGPFMPWPAESNPRKRRRGLSAPTVELVVQVWLKVLGGMNPDEANQAVANEHNYVYSTLRSYREELRRRKASLGS